MLRAVLQSLQQLGFAVIPDLADAATLDAMRCESAALLEQAEAAHSNDSCIDVPEASVAEHM